MSIQDDVMCAELLKRIDEIKRLIEAKIAGEIPVLGEIRTVNGVDEAWTEIGWRKLGDLCK